MIFLVVATKSIQSCNWFRLTFIKHFSSIYMCQAASWASSQSLSSKILLGDLILNPRLQISIKKKKKKQRPKRGSNFLIRGKEWASGKARTEAKSPDSSTIAPSACDERKTGAKRAASWQRHHSSFATRTAVCLASVGLFVAEISPGRPWIRQVLLFLTEQGHSHSFFMWTPGQGGQGNSGQFSTEDSEKEVSQKKLGKTSWKQQRWQSTEELLG